MLIGIIVALLTNLFARAGAPKPCHCRADVDWDSVSGTCKDGCEDGWSGESCEKGLNIALHGSAFQSSTFHDANLYTDGRSSYSADKAVDGRALIDRTTRNCAITYRTRNPWWYVVFNNSIEYNIESVTLQYFYQQSKQLPCNCLHNATCLDNGYCPNGCALNWTGPACLVGPLPRARASQSSTHIHVGNALGPWNAIDNRIGITNNESDVFHCAHTEPTRSAHWWQVIIDDKKTYVVESVTIHNRFEDYLRQRLSNFSIVYSTSVDSDMNAWKTKEICYSYPGELLDLTASFACTHRAIARSVGIEVAPRPIGPDNVLTLCEVYIYGYEYQDCPDNYTGPGCVLYSCYSNVCKSNDGTCDNYGVCNFQECPDKSFVPPLCWMRNFTSKGLVNFDILADDTGLRPPDPETWKTCQRAVSMNSTSSTFNCSNVRGQRLAVYVGGEDEQMLTLCEVTVTGFPTGDIKDLCEKPTGIATLGCHCAEDEQCTFANDFQCPGKCQDGWTGDDCRSSLIATFFSKSLQSNTLCDENLAKQKRCIFGSEMALDNDTATCTSTRASDYPWWLVQFDDNDAFVIEHVRIVSSGNTNENQNRNNHLLLLISSDSSGLPDPTIWHNVPYNENAIGSNGLSFNRTVIARRLAVYLNMRNVFLSICEIFIWGHRLLDDLDLSLSNVLLVQRSEDRTVYVAVNLSKRLWYHDPTTLSMVWQHGGQPGGRVHVAYDGPRWYTTHFNLEDYKSSEMAFWWETQYCPINDNGTCHNSTKSVTMVAQSNDY